MILFSFNATDEEAARLDCARQALGFNTRTALLRFMLTGDLFKQAVIEAVNKQESRTAALKNKILASFESANKEALNDTLIEAAMGEDKDKATRHYEYLDESTDPPSWHEAELLIAKEKL